jgi:hypothetical protein
MLSGSMYGENYSQASESQHSEKYSTVVALLVL